MKTFFKQNGTTIISTLVGIIVTYFIATSEFTTTNKRTPGGISIEQANTYAMQHSDHVIKDWRKRTHGIWYETDKLDLYLQKIKKFIADTTNKAIEGYTWKVGIGYGGGRKPTGDLGLLTMFMPVLVQDASPNNVIDVFVAKYYYQNDTTKTISADSKITYFYIYNKYYAKYNKQTDDEIIFDTGSMWP